MSDTVTNEALEAAMLFVEKLRPSIPVYIHLIVTAILPIYTGAHASLHRPISAAQPAKRKGGTEDDERRLQVRVEEETQPLQGFDMSDALLYPLLAGGMLTALYWLITYLQDASVLSNILNAYLSVFGLYGISQLLSDGVETAMSFVFPTRYWHAGRLWVVDGDHRLALPQKADQRDVDMEPRPSPLPGFLSKLPVPTKLAWWLRDLAARPAFVVEVQVYKVITTLRPTSVRLLCVETAVAAVVYFNLVDRPWWLTNLMGFSFTYSAFQMMSPTTFTTGTMLLTALFFYDIYMVFYTPMMITVASKLDIPAKLVFPRPETAERSNYAMLGLGDVVIPGMLIAFALRFDLYMFYLKSQKFATVSTVPATAAGGIGAGSAVQETTESSQTDLRAISESKNGDQPVDDTHNKELQGRGAALTLDSVKGSKTNSGVAGQESRYIKAVYMRVTGTWGDRFWLGRNSMRVVGGQFPKPYFWASVAGYLVGLVTTILIMEIFEHGQPALLYLVPSVLGAIWLTGLLRGEVGVMWKYTEDFEEAKKAGLGSASILGKRAGVVAAQGILRLSQAGQQLEERVPVEQPESADSSKEEQRQDRSEQVEDKGESEKPKAQPDPPKTDDRRIFSLAISLPPPPAHTKPFATQSPAQAEGEDGKMKEVQLQKSESPVGTAPQ